MRATIQEDAFGGVLLSYDDIDDDEEGTRVTREFRAPRQPSGSRAVMEVLGASDFRQVCRGLCSTGETLWLSQGQSLIALIRAEWRRAQRQERQEV